VRPSGPKGPFVAVAVAILAFGASFIAVNVSRSGTSSTTATTTTSSTATRPVALTIASVSPGSTTCTDTTGTSTWSTPVAGTTFNFIVAGSSGTLPVMVTANGHERFTFPVQAGQEYQLVSRTRGRFRVTITPGPQSSGQAPVITSPVVSALVERELPAFQITATGDPAPSFTWSGSPPPGLQLNPQTGELTGQPTRSGTFHVSVTATVTATATGDVGISPPSELTIYVNPAQPFTSAAFTTFTQGTRSSFQVKTSATGASATTKTTKPGSNGIGGVASPPDSGESAATSSSTPTITWSGRLPSGVTFDSITGTLAGTPAAGESGAFHVTFTVPSGTVADPKTARQDFVLYVDDPTGNATSTPSVLRCVARP
jgi:hypothetical protein